MQHAQLTLLPPVTIIWLSCQFQGASMTNTWRKHELGYRTIYEELGVKPIINAAGDMTVFGGSTVTRGMQTAMEEANEYFVNMPELLEKTGRYVASLLGCEGALITSGCFAALVLSCAAIMAGKDPDKIARIPDTTGMKNEFLIQKRMRYHYDRFPSVAGGKLVEVGDEEKTTAEQLEAAIGPNTAAIVYLARVEEEEGFLSIPEVVSIAKSKGVAVVIDAAGEVYPLERMRWLPNCGADVACFGTKYVGSHHSTGLLTGRKEVVEAATLHNFIAFESEDNHSFGRGYKVDRQEIVGTVVALREWLGANHEDRLQAEEEHIAVIERELAGVPHIKTERFMDRVWLRLRITFDIDALGKTATSIAKALREGEPEIRVRDFGDNAQFMVTVHHLRQGEDKIVGERLREVITG